MTAMDMASVAGTGERLRLCFILEQEYREDPMPLVVVDRLRALGHRVDVVPAATTSTGRLIGGGYDACVLKTASRGRGIALLEAAAAAGVPTINRPSSVRRVRDKAAAACWGRRWGLPVPPSVHAAGVGDLEGIAAGRYPLVVKPNRGSGNQGVFLVESPSQLRRLPLADVDGGLLIQSYVDNPGYDLKLYHTGREVFAVRKASPLHGPVEPELVPVTPELRELTLAFGRAFDLDVYGVDVVWTPQGWVAVDVNDFPSFGGVPLAVERLAASIVWLVERPAARPALAA
jgi:ribosomal protein S6--L-glutamate ligase